MLFTSWKDILHLHQLSLRLPVSCDSMLWPDMSALQVLLLNINGGKTEWKLNTLLSNLSLQSLTIHVVAASYTDTALLMYTDCTAIRYYIASTTSLKELHISSDTSDEKGMEAITASLASNQPLPLERLELGGKFTTTAEESLAEFITNTTTLKYLLFTGSIYGMEVITAALASNKLLALERLELKCKVDFAPIAGDRLAQFITNATTLKHLSIQWCGSYLSAHPLLVLARAIHHNSALQYKNVEDFTLMVNGENEAKDFVQLLVEYPHLILSRRFSGAYVEKVSSPISFTVNGDNEAKVFAQLLVDYQYQLNEGTKVQNPRRLCHVYTLYSS